MSWLLRKSRGCFTKIVMPPFYGAAEIRARCWAFRDFLARAAAEALWLLLAVPSRARATLATVEELARL